ncbi:hypothetical protein MMC12_004246 [Toensbergia leucococca]|nr:hypothetical protein [Toensbergia leucococca]
MLKSILKKSNGYALSNTSPPSLLSREDRNRETALYHANLIQQRKDVETLILSSTETLLDFPSSTISDPAHPSPEDADMVKAMLKPFQPSDYDSLIEERNIDHKCGYVLCSRQCRHENTNAKFRIIQGIGQGSELLKVVEKGKLEQWCSVECGKRALFLRVQLSEVPAWTRTSFADGAIMLLEEEDDAQKETTDMVRRMQGINFNIEERNTSSDLQDLAIERGERVSPGSSSDLIEATIRENNCTVGRTTVHLDSTSELSHSTNVYDFVEGYRAQVSDPRGRHKLAEDEEDESQDMMRTI